MNPESSSQETAIISTNTLVRTPRENPKQDVSTVATEGTTTEPNTTSSPETSSASPRELTALGRPPYVTELLGAGQAYNTFDVKSQLLEIDAYLQADTKKEYEKNFEELKAYINTEDIYATVESIRDYVRVQQKLRDALQAKKDFEAMDPLDMTSQQLEKWINNANRHNA